MVTPFGPFGHFGHLGLQAAHREWERMRRRSFDLHHQCAVFEIEHQLDAAAGMLAVSLAELQHLKETWDLLSLARSQLDLWRNGKWDAVPIPTMEDGGKEFVKSLRALDQCVVSGTNPGVILDIFRHFWSNLIHLFNFGQI